MCVRQPPAPVGPVSTLAMILDDDAEKPPLSAHRVSISVLPTVSTPPSILSFNHPPFEPPTAPLLPNLLSPSTSFPIFLRSLSGPPRPQPSHHHSLTPTPSHIHTLVHNPSHINPPGSVLTPVTSPDLDIFQCSENSLPIPFAPRSSSATSSRKRSEDEGNMSPKKLARDNVIVALHCTHSSLSSILAIVWLIPAPTDNARPEVGVNQRRNSPILV